jgi:hypothetical protein
MNPEIPSLGAAQAFVISHEAGSSQPDERDLNEAELLPAWALELTARPTRPICEKSHTQSRAGAGRTASDRASPVEFCKASMRRPFLVAALVASIAGANLAQIVQAPYAHAQDAIDQNQADTFKIHMFTRPPGDKAYAGFMRPYDAELWLNTLNRKSRR